MSQETNDANREHKSDDAPPDEGMAYDPSMTDEDEANTPPDSDADPNASQDARH
jgi:hypothetical protein